MILHFTNDVEEPSEGGLAPWTGIRLLAEPRRLTTESIGHTFCAAAIFHFVIHELFAQHILLDDHAFAEAFAES